MHRADLTTDLALWERLRCESTYCETLVLVTIGVGPMEIKKNTTSSDAWDVVFEYMDFRETPPDEFRFNSLHYVFHFMAPPISFQVG